MENEEKKLDNLTTIIQSIILKYCPFIEERLYFLDDVRKSKDVEIKIDFSNNKTRIEFLIGTYYFKQSIDEFIDIEYYMDFSEFKNLIDFIFNDNKIITCFDVDNKNILNLQFAINWTNSAVKGLDCNKMRIDINFNNNIDLRNYYLLSLFNNYYRQLENVPSFMKIKNNYLNKIKVEYFSLLNKSQIISYVSQLSEAELKELIFNINNETFIKYNTTPEQKQSSMKLILQKCKNDYNNK